MTKAEVEARGRRIKELKATLTIELGKAASSGPIWEQLEEDGHIENYLDRQAEPEDVTSEAQRLLRYRERLIEQGGVKSGPPERKEFVVIELDEREREHAEALKHYLARRATALPLVRQFRDAELEGDLLTLEQAEEFLRAEELKDSPEEELSKNSSYAGHVYNLSREELKDLVIPSHPRDRYFSEEGPFTVKRWEDSFGSARTTRK